MKTPLIILLICIVSMASAQTADSLKQHSNYIDEEIFLVVDQQAEFPGGIPSMMIFLQQNVKYPLKARKKRIQGKVFVKFIVEKDGVVSNIELLKDVSPLLDEEALRVVHLMPRWIPAQHEGKIVRSQFVLPIYFQLTK